MDTNIVPILRYEGQQNGVSTYSGTIDNKALMSLIKKISAEQNDSMSATEIKDMEDALKRVTLSTSFSLDKQSFTSFGAVITFRNVSDVSTGAVMNGSITINSTVAPLSTDIVAPANAQEWGSV